MILFQDVVYALAHATGKTGRFTLIERWRNNERLLAPQEHPLKVRERFDPSPPDSILNCESLVPFFAALLLAQAITLKNTSDARKWPLAEMMSAVVKVEEMCLSRAGYGENYSKVNKRNGAAEFHTERRLGKEKTFNRTLEISLVFKRMQKLI